MPASMPRWTPSGAIATSAGAPTTTTSPRVSPPSIYPRSLHTGAAAATLPSSLLASSPVTSPDSPSTPIPTSLQNENWLQTTMANQISNLDVELQFCDFVQHSEPSLFGLRRKIAAALPQLGLGDQNGAARKLGRRSRATADSGDIAAATGSDDSVSTEAPFQIVTRPARHDDSSSSSSSSLSPLHAITSSHNHAKQVAKLERELQDREKDLQVQLLSRFEVSELNMDVYTEQRTGEWTQRGSVPLSARPAESLPRIFSPWDISVDTKAIIRRNKLRSFVELVDSSTVLKCPECNIFSDRKAGYRYNCEPCARCESTGLVKMVYVVCVTLRHVRFLPLQLPLVHLGGWFQDSIRLYLHTPEQHVHPDTLQLRATEAIRSSAYRVGMAHAQLHDARLLCAKATLHRRSCNSVIVLDRLQGGMRTFDVTDSGLLQSGSTDGSAEDAVRIRETSSLTRMLASYPLVVRSDGLYNLVGVDRLVRMTRNTMWRQFSIAMAPSLAAPTTAPSSPHAKSETATLYSARDSHMASSYSPSLGPSRSLGTRSAIDLPSTARDVTYDATIRAAADSAWLENTAASSSARSAVSFFSFASKLSAKKKTKKAAQQQEEQQLLQQLQGDVAFV